MKKAKAVKSETTYLPVTAQQFEDLTNEILERLNDLNAPHFFSGDYVAQVLMSAIHALDHKIGIISKKELFHACVNRISCHITYQASQAIQERLKGAAAVATTDDADPGSPEALEQVMQ